MLASNTTAKKSDYNVLLVTRILGYLFASMLICIVSLAMIPNQFFIVSTRAVVNAPVHLIAAPIYGRVDKISLQVGQVVNPGDVTATVSNPHQDQTSLTGLRLEKLDLTERLNSERETVEERKRQLETTVAQLNDVRTGIIRELSAVIEGSRSTVQSYEARLKEQDALLERQMTLVRRKVASDASVEPQLQKRNAAQYDLDVARGEMRRNEIVLSLVQQNIYTGGPVSANLLSLEMQNRKLASDISDSEIAIRQMSDRKKQVENLIAREEGRLGNTGSAEVVADNHGQIVSVDAAFGEFLVQGQTVARSLDCSEAFVAAAYKSRDVAELAIGTPATVNFRSLGVKRTAQIHKIVRYFNAGAQDRYFEEFPAADGDEVYVILKFEQVADGGAEAEERSDDKFFGCHVGEDVIVALGEPIVSRLARYSGQLLAALNPSPTVVSASPISSKAERGSRFAAAEGLARSAQ
ncbi:hypothetical protein [Ensifer sp. LCM 4579]|uniref:hypothetical protein n=1 Tax=Ensifer sp. LCM 4579 TaxID=1848292 RepID=UPI0008DA6832|nr:hypothetical protein [Ensifer sp. LCM 4579]OHV82411.1 hypothetical protein LCM4579_17750 [Ensifer sp. LCM 4579]